MLHFVHLDVRRLRPLAECAARCLSWSQSVSRAGAVSASSKRAPREPCSREQEHRPALCFTLGARVLLRSGGCRSSFRLGCLPSRRSTHSSVRSPESPEYLPPFSDFLRGVSRAILRVRVFLWHQSACAGH
jgi:hypothetical protein